jgi:hypothetical protein
MFTEQRRLILVVTSILLCLLGGIGVITIVEKKNGCYKERAPLRTIVVSLDTSQQEQLFELFREFADQYGFAIQIRQTTPTGKDFIIVMTHNDVEVIARNPFKWSEFIIGIYNNDCICPTPASDIDGLVTNLKSLLSEIPNAIISDKN